MSAPRRTKAERGIYYRDIRRAGKPVRVYEITYTDRFGKQRWETVKAGGINAARALRGSRLTTGGPDPAPAMDTVAQAAVQFMAAKRHLRPGSRGQYQRAIDNHILPWRSSKTAAKLGDRPIASITVDVLADFIADLRDDDLAEWSIRAVCTPLRGILKHALRRGLLATDPWTQLTADEKPGTENVSHMVILDRDAITDLIDCGGRYRLILLVAVFTGLRLGELLALTWSSLDLKAGVLHVTEQINDRGRRGPVKTARARRKIVLPAFVVKQLVEHRLASSFSADKAPVFANRVGSPLSRDVTYGAVRRARRDANQQRSSDEKPLIPHLRPHDLRHTYASILIAQGEDVIFVSRQLGHTKASTTLDIYADLFDEARHADRARERLDNDFGQELGG